MKIRIFILLLAFSLEALVFSSACDQEEGPCTDACISGVTECSGDSYRTCGNYDSNNCLEWSDDTDCESGQICLDDRCRNISDVSTAGISLSITDGCNDGFQINYRFFDVDHNLAWPTWESHYYTESYNVKYTSNLSCIPGANICFGAEQGQHTWGVGLDIGHACQDCCIDCAAGATYGWNLTCN